MSSSVFGHLVDFVVKFGFVFDGSVSNGVGVNVDDFFKGSNGVLEGRLSVFKSSSSVF